MASQARSAGRRRLGCALKVFGGLLALLVLATAIFIVFVLPAFPITGAGAAPPKFQFRAGFDIEKSGPGGVTYTVNNSVATFRLDVAPPDNHCRRLFRDYASALRYCRASGLPTVPSVHLVQGKCKQFDDGLCAALETCVQRGVPGDDHLSKSAALSKLLDHLQELLPRVPPRGAEPVRSAIVHVGTAMSLAGTEPQVGSDLAAEIMTAKASFLAEPLRSQATGFWTWSDEFRRVFQQDRYLAQGFKLKRHPGPCLVLAATISQDAGLAEAFRRFRQFGAKLTNPPVYIDPQTPLAPPAACASCDDLVAVLPADTSLADVLASTAFERACLAAQRRFGEEAGFALVSLAASKEYDILRSLALAGDIADGDQTMQLIIDAVKSGRLRLEPKPNSGWYDYQWHALETLLCPDRALESPKLTLSAKYRVRLQAAFKALLTKHRETHIKRLPVVYLGGSIGGPEPPPKVEIGPKFAVEPTATVYLRYARAYRFLRTALHAELGRDLLRHVHRINEIATSAEDGDTELRRMSMICYGLYERLCLEIGIPAKYLPDEMAGEDIEVARTEAARWLSSIDDDPDVSRDTRCAVPITYQPGGPTRYWGTAGIKLERVVYGYDEEPRVRGAVEPVFVPTTYYLPTDVYLEFERPSTDPLTRDEFRQLCDRCEDEAALRAALGATRPEGLTRWLYLATGLLGALAATVFLTRRLKRKLRVFDMSNSLSQRRIRFLKVGSAVLLLVYFLALLVLPSCRTKIMVKYVARINDHMGVFVETYLYTHRSRGQVHALADMLSDSNPQIRYLAARFLGCTAPCHDLDPAVVLPVPGLQTKLRAAVKDDLLDVAITAIWMLGYFDSEDTVDLLLTKLAANAHIDIYCQNAICALGRIGNQKALDAVVPFTRDERSGVREAAVRTLACYNDLRAVQCAENLLSSGNNITKSAAEDAVRRWHDRFGRKSERDVRVIED